MDQFPQMLFKAGGPEQFHGGNFDTLVVQDDEQLADALAAGWSESTVAALDALKPENDKAPAVTGKKSAKAGA